MLAVARHITSDFRFPIFGIARRHSASTAAMPMPQTSVNHHYRTMPWQHNVRLAWQCGNVEPIPQAKRKQCLPQPKLGRCVLAVNARHDGAARRFVYGVAHVAN